LPTRSPRATAPRRAAISATAALRRRRSCSFASGYAPPDRFALKEYLGAQGISTEDMVEAGLLVSGEDKPVPFDRFRDRVMFPITDARGRVIAFGGPARWKRTFRQNI
jgi:DNA primase